MTQPIGPGYFVAVVGASGVGKDAIISWVRSQPGTASSGEEFPRRTITRSPGPGEDHDYVEESVFLAAEEGHGFAIAWRAHGLSYGIPIEADETVRAGGIVVANVSRAVLPALRERYEQLRVVRVEVSESIRRSRLADRGRETVQDVEERIARADPAPGFPIDFAITNDSTVYEAGRALVGYLESLRARHPIATDDRSGRNPFLSARKQDR